MIYETVYNFKGTQKRVFLPLDWFSSQHGELGPNSRSQKDTIFVERIIGRDEKLGGEARETDEIGWEPRQSCCRDQSVVESAFLSHQAMFPGRGQPGVKVQRRKRRKSRAASFLCI